MIRFTTVNGYSPTAGRLLYRTHTHSFDFEPEQPADIVRRAGKKGTTSILVGTLQIEVGVETGVALFVWGLHSHISRWRREHLPHMLLEAGGVRVLPDEELTAGIALSFAEVGELHTTYDVDSGWIHVSRDLIYSADRYLEFADNIVVGITDEQMMSLWLRPVFTT